MKARLANIIHWNLMVHIAGKESIAVETGLSEDVIQNGWGSNMNEYWKKYKALYPEMNGLGTQPVYDTPSGNLEEGCLYFQLNHYVGRHWDNDTDIHLMAVCPGGHHWDLDSRASNCTMPNDRTHRCWVRHGEAPNITVDKNGITCGAGAGSIQTNNYHGFLRNGEFTNA